MTPITPTITQNIMPPLIIGAFVLIMWEIKFVTYFLIINIVASVLRGCVVSPQTQDLTSKTTSALVWLNPVTVHFSKTADVT